LLNMSLTFACFIDKAFFWQKVKLPVLGLLYSSARLSGFPCKKVIGLKEICCITIFISDILPCYTQQKQIQPLKVYKLLLSITSCLVPQY
jgi:hypothetical protein